MPIFDMVCKKCKFGFEFLQIRSDDIPVCPKCQSTKCKKVPTARFQVRMDPTDVLNSKPDPVPPLTELIGKNKKGTEGGYKELANNERQLKNFERKKDKYGNSIWNEKRKLHIDMGKNNG